MRHALDKLAVLRQWGFTLDRDGIVDHLARPHESSPGYMGRAIATLQLDENHVLRVVYEENG